MIYAMMHGTMNIMVEETHGICEVRIYFSALRSIAIAVCPSYNLLQ
jgi:hypothetical protein